MGKSLVSSGEPITRRDIQEIIMMLLLTTTVLLVSSALALPAIDPTAKPCCPPNRWWAQMLDLNSDLTYSMNYAVDSNTMKEAVITTSRFTGEVFSYRLTDYNTNMIYTQNNYGAQNGQCVKTKNTRTFVNCQGGGAYPANVKYSYIGNATMGGPGSGGLLYDAWMIQYTDPGNEMNVTISMSRDTCAPLLEKVITPQTNMVLLFNNINATVDDAFLSLPPACQPVVG